VWVTVSARRVDPGELLERAAAQAGLRVRELVAFDGSSAAIAPRLRSLDARHEDGAPLGLDDADRERLDALLRTAHADPTVQDIALESHLPGAPDVARVQVLAFHDLLERVAAGNLAAGVRYLSD
jgi:hypothetical protein